MRADSLRPAFVAAVVLASLASLVALTPTSAHATPITVNNFSFESPAVPTQLGYIANPALGGWTFETIDSPLNYYVQLFESTMPAVSGVTDGNQYLGLYTHNSTTRVYQDTGVAWAPNTVYTLSLALGNRDHSQNVGATTHFGLSTDNTVANIVGAASVVNTELIAQQDWDTFTYSITTGAVAPVGNLFIVLTKEGQGGDARIQLDNVLLDASAVPPAPAPEPASLALIAGGLVFALRRRKNVKQA